MTPETSTAPARGSDLASDLASDLVADVGLARDPATDIATEKEAAIIDLTAVEPLEHDATLELHEPDHHDAPQGEHLWVDERLVVSPAGGRFWYGADGHAPEQGEFLVQGQFIGHVVAPDGNPIAVRSPFSGWAMGFLIPNGSPVKASEPVLWLRAL